MHGSRDRAISELANQKSFDICSELRRIHSVVAKIESDCEWSEYICSIESCVIMCQ